jgi:hypothetical protein
MTTTVKYVKLFNPQLLGTAAQLIYQLALTPASLQLRGARIRFTNTSGSAVAFDAYAVPNGVSGAANNNAFALNVSVAAGAFFDIDVPILSIGDAIWANAAVASVMNVQIMNGVLIQ